MNQVTEHPPMNEAIRQLHAIESQPGVVCGSIATCFPLADVPDMGASVTVVTDNDMPRAQSLADELASWIFARRGDWQLEMPTTRVALQRARANGSYPAIVADRNDNTGGGSPGDSTGMLQTFVDEQPGDGCILYIVDPEAVQACATAGTGATFSLAVGGKSAPEQGPPVPMTAEVVALSDGRFRYAGPMCAGLEGSMGPSAYIRQGGVHVLLVTAREQPYDTAFAESMGLDPRRMQFIGVKSAAHFRANFGPWAGQIQVVSEPGIHSPQHVWYDNLGRNVYPVS